MAQDLYVVKAGLVAVHQQQFVRVAGYSSTHRQSRATSLCGFGGRRTLRVQVQSRTQHVPERTRRLPEYKRSKRTKVTAYELQGPGLHANEQDNEPLCNTRNKQTNERRERVCGCQTQNSTCPGQVQSQSVTRVDTASAQGYRPTDSD